MGNWLGVIRRKYFFPPAILIDWPIFSEKPVGKMEKENAMPHLELFSPERIIGMFRGLHRNGLEFDAEIVLPYRAEFSQIPLYGQFVLVQLGRANEALLARVVALHPGGRA